MDDLEALVKEWEDIRDQIKRRVEQRNYMTEIMVAIVSGLLTVVFTNNALVSGIVPFITVFFMLLIKASYIRHRCLTDHLRNIEILVNKNLRNDAFIIPFWEISFSEKKNTNRHMIYNAFNVGILSLCGTIFTFYAIPLYIKDLPVCIILGTLYLCGASSAVISSLMDNCDIQS